MVVMKTAAALLAVLATTVSAVDIAVHASGGNDTTRMPYGLMHEVQSPYPFESDLSAHSD